MAFSVDSQVQYLKGVGPKLGSLLKVKGISTIRDLLQNYPRAYEDRRAARSISSLKVGDYVGLVAQVAKVSAIPMGRTGRKIYDIAIRDTSGLIHCKFFRVPYKGYFERFKPGTEVRVIGKVINYRNQLEFHHPELAEVRVDEEENQDELIPIYSETEGLSSKKFHGMVLDAVEKLEMHKRDLPELEVIPQWILDRLDLPSMTQAMMNLHFPREGHAEKYLNRETRSHRRIIFEEFFLLEMLLASRKQGVQNSKATPIKINPQMDIDFFSKLPFDLTNAQKKVLQEIYKDLQNSQPMQRMVQGDVGSGKTVVALAAAAQVIASGAQVAFMAPTEILAQQHYKNARKYLDPLGIRTEFLSGQLKSAERKTALPLLKSGEAQLVIGTHALIQEGVDFKNLSMVIVDEQHRFGVEQRGLLKSKGVAPHFLLMTATPIPRSLAMTIYGDLDTSIINEMPVGRIPIVTRATYQSKRPQVTGFIKEHLEKGRQAYVVYPLVEESEKIDLKSATTEFERLKLEFSDFKVGLLHGRMKGEEKDAVMLEFKEGRLDILVSTTVIEVGVDVPNANIMWIEHSERFGLSQLHQLRGRVGRGEHKSYCIMMMGHAVSEEARERVSFLETTNDGFKISEFDLELRGPGEFLGVRQSGMPGFKMANLVKDLPILEQAREFAFELLQKDPNLKQLAHRPLRDQVALHQANLS
ncbi:MAG: ATP-dependent DNA helicase RecG [Bdellovibrionales bacterium]|nr:ATP-dependent DNA helicase RecG [Bdellovibrionales bacterium]